MNKTPITERIKSFEDACDYLDLNPHYVLPPETIYNAKYLIASAKLAIITKALNERWVPDWNNKNEWKYYPWFDMLKLSSELSCGATNSLLGTRICFKSSRLARYAGTQFLDIYKDFMLIDAQNENPS